MTYILNAAKTMRNLVHNAGAFGSGPFYYSVAGTRVIEFWDTANHQFYGGNPVPVEFKPGATIYHDPTGFLATIQGGSGFSWTIDQPAPFTSNGYQDWYTSDKTSAKGRNSTGVPGSNLTIPGMLVPDAIHYIYAAPLDDGGNPDYYVYVDTLQPERSVHPYTRDVSIGSFKTVPRTLDLNKRTGRPIMDLATRVRNLEGVVRAGRSAGSAVQDDRLAKIVARLVAFETWANGPGHFGTPPAVGSGTVYVEDDFIQAGDQA